MQIRINRGIKGILGENIIDLNIFKSCLQISRLKKRGGKSINWNVKYGIFIREKKFRNIQFMWDLFNQHFLLTICPKYKKTACCKMANCFNVKVPQHLMPPNVKAFRIMVIVFIGWAITNALFSENFKAWNVLFAIWIINQKTVQCMLKSNPEHVKWLITFGNAGFKNSFFLYFNSRGLGHGC